MNPEELFIRRSVAFARTLPFSECISYLRGMLHLCGGHDQIGFIRETYTQLSHCDSQLELIGSGQMQFALKTEVHGTHKSGREEFVRLCNLQNRKRPEIARLVGVYQPVIARALEKPLDFPTLYLRIYEAFGLPVHDERIHEAARKEREAEAAKSSPSNAQ